MAAPGQKGRSRGGQPGHFSKHGDNAGLILVLAACYLFLNGQYFAGLLAGWIMTFLDTVDGKLARVTVQSSKFGHLYDHLIDLFHPPFWYIYWGMSLGSFGSVLGFDQEQMYWLIIIGYVAGRIVEGIFPLLGNCTIFTWQPFRCLVPAGDCAAQSLPDHPDRQRLSLAGPTGALSP